MVHRKALIALLFLVPFVGGDAFAGKYNPKLSIGDRAPEWMSLSGVDGGQHSFDDYESAEVLVVVFTSNTCPYAHDYESRLKQLDAKYAKEKKVKLIVLNPNAVRDDSLDAMKKYAKQKKFGFTYLKDEDGGAAASYGALRTPECFVIDRDRKIHYMGAFDDNTKADQVTVKYVEAAVDAALEGKVPEVQETPPVGCLIRQRRRR